MISKDKIKKTTVCYWVAEDKTFVAESSLLPHAITGAGPTKEKALESFDSMLNANYDEISGDNLAGYKMGRPAKGYVAFNTNVRPASKARIAELASEMDISQGEVLDYLLFFFDCKLQEQVSPNQNQLAAAIEALRAQQAELVKHLNSVGISLPSARDCSQP